MHSVPQCVSPEWATVILLEHTPGTEHRIAVDIFHSHTGQDLGTNISQNPDQRGTLTFEDASQLCGILLDVETILSHRDQTLVERIPGSGRVIVRLECSSCHQEFKFHLRGLDIQNTRRIMLERPSLYFEVRRKQTGRVQDTWSLVYRSKCAEPSLNPYWDCDIVPLELLVNGDLYREIRISVWDYSPDRRVLVGWCATTVQGLMEAQATQGNADRTKALELFKGETRQRSEGVGRLVVLHASVSGKTQVKLPEAIAVPIMTPPMRRNCTFDEYVSGGHCTLELCVAVDCTQSNGDFRLEGTPHYRCEEKLNDYEWCMGVIAESISSYNSSRQYPMWGFGAMFGNKPYHIFQCGPTACSDGTRGLLNSYRDTFQTGLEFGHERKYDDVIQAAAHFSKKQLVRNVCIIVVAHHYGCHFLIIITTPTRTWHSNAIDWRIPCCLF